MLPTGKDLAIFALRELMRSHPVVVLHNGQSFLYPAVEAPGKVARVRVAEVHERACSEC
jgi:hypothetical protein